jgi:transposase
MALKSIGDIIMYHCQLSVEDQHRIQVQRYRHPDPIIRKRLTILWHKHHGLPHHEIAKLSSASLNTVTTTIRTYIEEGLPGVEKREFYQPTSQIEPHITRLMAHFSENPPRTLKEAKAKIEQITGISFSLSHVRNLLLSMGLSKKKREAFQAN